MNPFCMIDRSFGMGRRGTRSPREETGQLKKLGPVLADWASRTEPLLNHATSRVAAMRAKNLGVPDVTDMATSNVVMAPSATSELQRGVSTAHRGSAK
jgi:hypothetical protein